ncbi:MAG: hypothetical protein A2W74_10080 [Planctomycetes bacterium RIFCSPLOWO2_12_38_17]|nr:MAG: hypothetical protein A2W74_10080 [Planctomycetes bacterium RIFCSPLOWO2_12_38_17]
MKIIFVYIAWNEMFGNFTKLARTHSLLPPLGVVQLASYIGREGHVVKMIDTQVYNGSVDDLLSEILKESPDIVGISSLTPNFHLAKKLASMIKNKADIFTIIGGVHFTLSDDSEFYSEFDYGIRGEGELPLSRLLRALDKGSDICDIHGLTYRKNGQIFTNPIEFGLTELDNIPIPNWSLLPIDNYRMILPNRKKVQAVSIATARGCPFKCAFCGEPRLFGKKYKVHSPKRIVDEIEEIVNKHKITHFFFFDSTLTLRRELILEMCGEILNRKLKITFEGYTRVDRVDEELFTLMKRAGLVRISLGIESANEKILRLIQKQIDLDKVRNAFRIMRKLKIEAQSFAMIGNPGETRETIKETARFIRSVNDIKFSNLSIAVPYPGTELYEMAKKGEHGLKLLSKDYKEYNRYEKGVLEVNGLSPEELARLQKKYLIYMNFTPRKIFHLIKQFGLSDLLFTVYKICLNLLNKSTSN